MLLLFSLSISLSNISCVKIDFKAKHYARHLFAPVLQYPEMSGGTRSYEMARRIVAAGHEVHMVTSIREPKHQQRDWISTDEAGIRVHWYPVPYSNHMSYLRRIGAFLSFANAAYKKVMELRGDLIFATSTPLTIVLPAVPAARKKNIPMVLEVRDLWPEMPIAIGALRNPIMRFTARRLERWAYRNSMAVVALLKV